MVFHKTILNTMRAKLAHKLKVSVHNVYVTLTWHTELPLTQSLNL